MERARQRLTRRRILEAALELVDREGAAALSMRRLGRELGVEAMSLYNHVSGRDDVLDGLSELMIVTIDPAAGTGDWKEELRRFMHGIRAVALAHPAGFQLVALRPLNTREALPPVDALLGAMRAGGLDPRLAAFAYRLAVNYARGFVLAEIVGFTLDASSAHLRAPDLGPEELPNIVAFAPYLYGFDHDAAFEFGVETIVAGLERRLAAGPHG